MSEVVELDVAVGYVRMRVRRQGDGPALLLLHGFPQTREMWTAVAARLACRFTVFCADLPGYGESSCPPSSADHEPYSKRAFARVMVAVMGELGFERFAVAGHDRGGRVAYRAALDHPDQITRLAVLDILPIEAAWRHADERLALGFWPWSLLAQAAPLPEQMLLGAPEAVIEHALSEQWGTPAEVFSQRARAAYLAQLREPARVHAICEEYRAAATLDREHDAADLRDGRLIACPTLVLWSAAGPLGSWYAELGGPLALWRELAADVRGRAVEGGHFFCEEHPDATSAALSEFFGATD